jgi:hypothetical protein
MELPSRGYQCEDWGTDFDKNNVTDCAVSQDSINEATGYSKTDMDAIRAACPKTCGVCTATQEAADCNSTEASECSEYCGGCATACTASDGNLDLTSDSCTSALAPEGAWGCTGAECGCLVQCLKCAAYLACGTASLAEDQTIAITAALTEIGLSADDTTAVVVAITAYATDDSTDWTALYAKHAGNLKGLFADESVVEGLAKTAGLDASIQTSLAEAVEDSEAGDSGSAGLFSGIFAVAAMAFALL